MAKVKMIDDKPYWVDADGSLKPEECISNADKKKEEMIDDIFAGVFHARGKIADFKKHITEALDAYIEKLAKKAKVEGWKGNITLQNYDATRRIMIRKSEIQIFNEKLQFAKTKFDEWVVKKTQGGDADLSEIVQKAFEVDKAGQINKSFLFKLLRYSIKDPEFKKAQELLRESIETAGTKTYILFQIKNEKNGWDNLSIDFQRL